MGADKLDIDADPYRARRPAKEPLDPIRKPQDFRLAFSALVQELEERTAPEIQAHEERRRFTAQEEIGAMIADIDQWRLENGGGAGPTAKVPVNHPSGSGPERLPLPETVAA